MLNLTNKEIDFLIELIQGIGPDRASVKEHMVKIDVTRVADKLVGEKKKLIKEEQHRIELERLATAGITPMDVTEAQEMTERLERKQEYRK